MISWFSLEKHPSLLLLFIQANCGIILTQWCHFWKIDKEVLGMLVFSQVPMIELDCLTYLLTLKI